jgi:F-type H+-transporting ATPase subunit b
MMKSMRLPLLVAGLLAPASVAFAQHEAHGHLTPGSLFANQEFQGAVLNFLILVGIFAWAIRSKVKPFLVERRRQVVESLEEATRIKAEAVAKHEEYTNRLAKLDSELAQIRADMVKAGEAERDRIVADAERKAASVRHETEFLISQRMKELREELTRESIEAAVSAAERVLTEKTSADDQQRLAQSYLTAIAAVGKGNGGPASKNGGGSHGSSGAVSPAGALGSTKEKLA